MEFTNDNEFGVDFSRFVNCTGSIAGQPLDDIGNSYAHFDGTSDFATLPEFDIGDGTAGTVLARIRYNGSPSTSGPFNLVGSQQFYYVYPATTNIWCGDLRTSWVEGFSADAGIPKTDWHWVVIRTNAASGWEFLQATDTGTLSSRATASHQNFPINHAYGVIGKNRSDSDLWGGDIDRLLAFPTRLSDVQIQAIIAGGVGVGASLRYEFANTVNGRFVDSSVNAVDATITGTPDIIPLGGALTIAEVDGTPSDDIWKLVVPNGSLVVVDGIATLTVSGGGTPTAITVANEATDTTCYVGFFTGATGDLGPKTNAGLTFNSATGALGVGGKGVFGQIANYSTPSISWGASPTFGLDADSNNLLVIAGGVLATVVTPGGAGFNSYRLPSDWQFTWASVTTNLAASDTGVSRSAAGVVKITDGSTGTGALIAGSITAASLNLGGATVTDILSATATLNFGSIAAGAYEDLTITVTGAAVGDTVMIASPSGTADITIMGQCWASDTVTVRATNNHLTTAQDPPSGTYRATVVKI
jgi:hypothetical protein